MKNGLKLFVVRKYVSAKSAADAIKQERRFDVDDCWVDDDFKKEIINNKIEGFMYKAKPKMVVKKKVVVKKKKK